MLVFSLSGNDYWSCFTEVRRKFDGKCVSLQHNATWLILCLHDGMANTVKRVPRVA